MIVSIHQPAYLPWLGYCARIAQSDVHVVLNHVQFEKNSFINRNRVRTSNRSTWLTVPVKTRGRFGELPICDIEIDNSRDWRKKHWRTLSQAYGAAPYFPQHSAFFENIYRQEWTHLAPLCAATTEYLFAELGIETPVKRSSELPVEGAKDALVLNICRHVNADVYLSGSLGRNYLYSERFADAGIRVDFQDYMHPEYRQAGSEFVPNLSVVDLLFNCGPASREILLGANATAV